MNAACYIALQHKLTPPQHRCLQRIDSTRSLILEERDYPHGSRFGAPELGPPADKPPSQSPEGPELLLPGSVILETAECTAAEVPESAQVIGTVSLWPLLTQDFSWIDFVCIASNPTTGERQVLPIDLAEIEADASDQATSPVDIDSVRHALVVTEPTDFPLSQLQQALTDDQRCQWAFEYERAGVFLVVLLEFEQRSRG